MTIINVFALTASAIIQTLTGQAPVSIWFPLIEDITRNIADSLIGVLEILI